MEVLISVAVILLLMFLGQKVYSSFLIGSLLYVVLSGSGQATIAPLIAFAIDTSSLLAVPLFMLAGTLMEVSGIADRLIDFASVLLRKVKNGLGAVIPVASMFFGALCGSGSATCATMSSILTPKMSKMGWKKEYTSALIAASGPLGFMIPPNMNAIIYSMVANASIAALFLATIVPGIIWGVLYIIINRFIADKWIDPPNVSSDEDLSVEVERFNTGNYTKDLWSSFKYSIPAWMLPVIVMGGIYSGTFSPTEAGAVACVYALVLGFVMRKINGKNAFSVFTQAGKSLGGIFIIIPMCMLISRYLLIEGAPQAVVKWFTAISTDETVILLLINLLFFVAGMFFDANVLTLVLTPLILPTTQMLGLDPVQLGVMVFISLGIGAMTPPMAMNLFVVSSSSGVPVRRMVKPLMPFLLFGAIPVLLLTTFIPGISLWLPNLLL